MKKIGFLSTGDWTEGADIECRLRSTATASSLCVGSIEDIFKAVIV